jgi:hypothetical protein
MLILTHRGQKLLLDCKFDESLDEYPAVYKVYALPLEIDENALQSWDALPQNVMKYLGDIPVEQVMFDPSKRKEVDTTTLDAFLGGKLAS